MANSSSRWTGASIAFGLALFFIFAFVLMGYSAVLSVALGALGGCSTAWSLAWWSNPDPSPPKWTIGQRRHLERASSRSKIPGIEAAQAMRRIREQRSLRGRIRWFSPWRRGRRR